jgi:hypothetical protein
MFSSPSLFFSLFSLQRTESVVSDFGVAHVVVGREADGLAVRLKRCCFECEGFRC